MKSFQAFRLDTLNHCLWRAGERLQLAPKTFDVLCYLVERAGRLVTQEEMLEALWPETYVNPEVLRKYILEIRKVLGDRHDEPAFIETVPKRGYQFIAEVSDEAAAMPSDSSAESVRKMVGRESALAGLEAHLRKALSGQRQVVFVTGEGGIGKTTLLDAFQLRASPTPNLRIARGQCVEGYGGKEAYYPIFEALGQLIREGDGSPVAQALTQRAPTWLIQLPSILKAEQREALRREILGATRERMVRELCEALEAVTAEHPLVLILDDLHWADNSTLDVISAVARRREPAKMALIGAYRPADVVASRSPLKALKQDLLVRRLCEEVALERLEEPEIAVYLATEFPGGGLPSGLASLVYRHSGGNALFMTTITQDMVKQGLIALNQGHWALSAPLEDIDPGVPETLQQMVEVRFDQLTEAEQLVLKSACVAGDRFSVWTITPAVGIEPDRIDEVCEGLAERQQFIRFAGITELVEGAPSAQYGFRHSLYRQALYRRLSESNRSKLHRSVGERLKTHCAPDRLELASELALHFEKGRDYEQAVRFMMLAAENAARRFAHDDSIRTLRHGLKLIPKAPASARIELELQILERIGDAHYLLGAMLDSAKAYEAQASLAVQAGLKVAQVNALSRLTRPFGFLDPDRGIAAVERAEQVSASLDDPLLSARTRMLAAAARLSYDAWRKEDAEICVSSKQAILRLGGSDLPGYPEMLYSHLQSLQGDYLEALKNAEAGVALINETTDLITYYLALSGKMVALLHLGQFGEALRIVRAGKEMAEKNGQDPWIVFVFREAWLHTLALDFEGAGQICEMVMRNNTECPPGQPMTLLRLALAYAELDQGRHDQAIEYFEQVRDPQITPKFFLHWYWRMRAQLGLSDVWLQSGNLTRARNEADGFLKSALSTDDPNLQALGFEMRTRVAIFEKDWRGADEYIQKALAILQQFEVPVSAWRVHATAFDLYRNTKNEEAAEKHRGRAEALIFALANSLPMDEPLRRSLLNAPAVRLILSNNVSLRESGLL